MVDALCNAVETETLAQTLLFTGPIGAGKKTLADKVVQKLFCPDMCGRCKSCQMLTRHTHPDYSVIIPDDILKLDHARQVKSFLSTSPNTAAHKVAVLADCHKLTVEAANSLLKVLEEPPPASICILTADSVDNVLSTLVSRSQVYNLAPLPHAMVMDVLRDRGVSSDQAQILAGLSAGVLGRALAMLEDEEFWTQRRHFSQSIRELFAGAQDPILLAERWCESPERSLDLAETWLRDMLLLQTTPDYVPVNNDERESIEACIGRCPKDKTMILLEECLLARRRLRARCNSRLVFDSLLLKMWEV